MKSYYPDLAEMALKSIEKSIKDLGRSVKSGLCRIVGINIQEKEDRMYAKRKDEIRYH